MRVAIFPFLLALSLTSTGFAKDTYICPPCGGPCDTLTFAAAGTCPGCGMALVNQADIRDVSILIFDGVETLDFTGPHDTFGSAHGLFRVRTVARDTALVESSSGLLIRPSLTFADCPPSHVLVLPGGSVGGVLGDSVSMAFIRRMSDASDITLTVCSGAFMLAQLGMLDGLTATCHHGDIDQLRQAAPKAKIVDDRKWVDNGRIVTAAGVTSGIDASLHVIGRLHGPELARHVAEYLEFAPRGE